MYLYSFIVCFVKVSAQHFKRKTISFSVKHYTIDMNSIILWFDIMTRLFKLKCAYLYFKTPLPKNNMCVCVCVCAYISHVNRGG